MGKYAKTKRTEEETEKKPISLLCMDCGEPSDVHVCGHGFCAEHYRRRVANMKRNADKLVFEKGAYREPTQADQSMRAKVDRDYMAGKSRRAEQWRRNVGDLKTVAGMKSAADYISEES